MKDIYKAAIIGWLLTKITDAAFEDLRGLEGTIEAVRRNWINTQWWWWILPYVLVLWWWTRIVQRSEQPQRTVNIVFNNRRSEK